MQPISVRNVAEGKEPHLRIRILRDWAKIGYLLTCAKLLSLHVPLEEYWQK